MNYLFSIEYQDGKTTTKVVEPERTSTTIDWLLDKMEINKAYPVKTESQKDSIIEVWNIIHATGEYNFKFSSDYKEIKKEEI